MNSGYHNRHKKDRRDSPSSSSRPRSSSKTSAVNNEANQRNRTPPKTINGKMPSVANSPSSEAIITDGMANMVLENIRYPIGSKITAKLNNGSIMKGEIVAYDPKYKVVIMRTSATRPGHHNVSILNLSVCADIKVDEECKESPGEMHPLNIEKLHERKNTQIERKKKLITAFKAGIPPEGQQLFQYINKTLDDVFWHGDKILVMNKVIVDPPYRAEHVRIKQGVDKDELSLKNLNHIRKIVEKFFSESESKSIAGGSSTNTTPSGLSSYTDSAPAGASVGGPPLASASSRTAPGPPGVTPNTAGGGSTGLTTTIPNLPQAPAVPPSSSSSSHSKQPPGGGGSNPGGSRSNRNNAGRKQHHDHHSKTIFPSWAKFNRPVIEQEVEFV